MKIKREYSIKRCFFNNNSKRLFSMLIFTLFVFGSVSYSVLGATGLNLITPVTGNYYKGTTDITWSYVGTPQGAVRISYNGGSGWTFLDQVPQGSTTYSWNTDAKNGNYQVYIYEKDTGVDVESGVFIIDNTKPTIDPITISPKSGDYISGISTISASVTDTNGIVSCEYTLDGSIWVSADYSGGVCSVSAVDTSSASSINIRATDIAGNLKEGTAVSVTLDLTPPATTDSGIDEDWYTSDVTVTLFPDDAGSGIVNTYYCSDQVGSCTPTVLGTSLTVSEEGMNYVRYYSVDNVGNSEDVKTAINVVKIDKTKPVTSDDYGYDNVWVNSDQTITLIPVDVTSGIASTKYCIGNGCTPSIDYTVPVIISTEGINYFRYASTDNAGNAQNTEEKIVKIDKTTSTTTDDVPSGWQTTSPLIITLTPSDDGLSPITTYYTTDGSDPTTSSDTGTTITLINDGTYTIKYFTIDEAGNAEEIKTAANQVQLDANAPIFTSVTSDKSYYKDGDIITVTADLEETGLDVLGDFSNVDTTLPYIVEGYTGLAEYSNEQAHTGGYSIEMATATTSDQSRLRFLFNGVLGSIDSFSYWSYVVNGGTFGQLAIWPAFYLDGNNDGIWDVDNDFYLQCEPYYTYGNPTLNTWQNYDVMNMKCVAMEYAGDCPHNSPTLAQYISGEATTLQCPGHPEWGNFISIPYAPLPVIKIDMRAGYGGPWAGFNGYADDIEINSKVYSEPTVAVDNNDGSYTLTHGIVAAPSDGSRTIPVTATDASGNSNIDDSLSLGIDNTLPSVSITPITGWKKDTIDVEYTITEMNKDVCQYRYNGGGWSPISCDSQFSFDTNNCPDGTDSCTIDVKATDTAGNSATDSTTFSVDNSAPIITSLTLSDDTIQEGTSITITSDGTDPQGVKSCMAYLVSTDGLTQYQSYTLTNGCDGTETINPSPDVPDENYKIKVKVKNNADTISELTTDITIDDTTPVIVLIGEPYNVDEGGSIILDASASTDVTSGITTYEWDLDNDGQYDDVTGETTNFDASGLDGPTTKNIRLKLTDTAGNFIANDSITVTVNNVAPTSIAISDKTKVAVNDILSFTGDQTDPGLADTFTYLWDFGDGQTSTGQNPTYSYSAKGVYIVNLTVMDDNGGSTVSDNIEITVNSMSWDLASSWNLVSVPKTLVETEKAILLPGNTVYQYDNGWVINPTTIEPGIGYWVDNQGPETLGLDYAGDCTGPQCLPSGKINIDALQPQWNLIGLATEETVQAYEAFGSMIYDDQHLPVYYVISYDEENDEFAYLYGWDDMNPGEGYWVYIDK